MKFFLILLTASLICIKTFANEVIIVAKVNKTVITNVDVSRRMNALSYFVPSFSEYTDEQRHIIGIQSLVDQEMKNDYIKRLNIPISDKEIDESKAKIIENLKTGKIKDSANFISENEDFLTDEARWNIVVEKNIIPSIQINEETINAIQEKESQLSKEQIKEILIQQQVQSQTAQIIESLKSVSVIETNTQ